MIDLPLLPGSLLLFATVMLGLALSLLAWLRRGALGAVPFSLFSLSAAVWAGFNGLEYITLLPENKIFWARMAYLGIATLPVFWFIFAVRFSKQSRLLENRARVAILFIIPVITIGMAFTNDWHHLLWSRIDYLPGSHELIYWHGIWFWIAAGYDYILLLLGLISIVLTTLVRYPHLYRRQGILIVIGALFPWVFNILYLAKLNPFPGIDLTPFGFSISGLIMAMSIFRFRLFELLPIARDSLVENMNDGVLVLNQTGQIVDVNPAALRMLVVSATNLIGQDAMKVFQLPFDALAPPGKAPEGMGTGKKPDPLELEMTVSRDPPVILELFISPLYLNKSQYAGWLVLLRDITERKKMEEELRKARDLAEASSRYKSEFLANMSHEIRTPMNAVIGMTSLLLDTSLNDEQKDWLEIIRNSGEALLGIINDILDYSRIESGKLPLEQQAFSLRTCIEESLDVISVRAAEKNIELLFEIDDQTPDLLIGDAMRLRQVLVNLLNNAVKFTSSGEVLVTVRRGVTVSLEPGHAPDGQNWIEVHFAVKDTGIGIPEDRLDRLFQPFSQVDSSITRKYGGSGLGLAICKRLVEMMGGRIWVESMPNLGSTFYFTIWSPVSEEMRNQPAVMPAVLARKCVLIVDSSPNSCRILTGLAEKAGMQVLSAVSVDEALALPEEWAQTKKQPAGSHWSRSLISIFDNTVRVERPSIRSKSLRDSVDVIVVDRRLEGLDRLMSRLKGIPVVLMAPPSRSGLTGKLDYVSRLHKPVRAGRFYTALARALQPAFAAEEAEMATYLLEVEARRKEKAERALETASIVEEDSRLQLLQETLSQGPSSLPDGLNVLIAEDNPANQKVIDLILGKLGYQADIVGDGIEAIEALDQKRYAVVLMDMQMPEMDGLEATRLIRRSLPADRQPWIIAMTANVMGGDRERCLEAGMNDYVSKPVRIDELEQAFRRCGLPGDQVGLSGEPGLPSSFPLDTGGNTGLNEVLIDPSDGPIDVSTLDNLVSFLGLEKREPIEELVSLFRTNTRILINQLENALTALDLPILLRTAHTIKSASSSVGANILAGYARDLETKVRILQEGQSENGALFMTPQMAVDIALLINKVQTEFDRAEKELKKRGY